MSRCLPVLVVALLASCVASPPALEISVGLFAPNLSGDAKLGTVGSAPLGPDIDLSSDLDLDDRDIVPVVRVGGSLAGFNLRASAFQTDQGGTGFLTAKFGDIEAGSAVRSELDLLAVQALLSYNIIEVGFLRIAPGVGIDYFDLDLDVREKTFGSVQSLDVRDPVPIAFLDLEINPPAIPLSLKAEVGGIAGRYGDFDGKLIDGQALLFLELGKGFELFGGYRHLQADLKGRADGRDFETDLVLSGWMAGLSLRF